MQLFSTPHSQPLRDCFALQIMPSYGVLNFYQTMNLSVTDLLRQVTFTDAFAEAVKW